MLRLGYTCARVADCMRVYDEVVMRIGWALRAAGVDVQGLAILRKPERISPPAPAPVVRRVPAHIIRERRREGALAVS